jgi:hypothetical protein
MAGMRSHGRVDRRKGRLRELAEGSEKLALLAGLARVGLFHALFPLFLFV